MLIKYLRIQQLDQDWFYWFVKHRDNKAFIVVALDSKTLLMLWRIKIALEIDYL